MLHRIAVPFALALLLASAASAQSLKVGDDAPALTVSKWLNGKEVAKFEKGTVYVIDCWATSSAPSVQTLPLLSALNTKMKDKGVVFIGLSVRERDPSQVEPFVKKMGGKLNFVVAIDQGQSDKDWVRAARLPGIPCSFVVDKEGKIAWIGHPRGDLDAVVEAVATGTFDAKAYAKKQAELGRKVQGLQRKLQEAGAAQDWDKVLATIDEIAAALPEARSDLALARFGVLTMQKKDFPAAYAMAKRYLEKDLKDDAHGLNGVAWFILTQEGLEQRDHDIALAISKRSAELTDFEDPAILDTLARAYFEKQDVDKAIELQTKAIAKAGDTKGEQLDEMKAALIRYQSTKVQ